MYRRTAHDLSKVGERRGLEILYMVGGAARSGKSTVAQAFLIEACIPYLKVAQEEIK